MKNIFNFNKGKNLSTFKKENVHPNVYEHLNSEVKLDSNGNLKSDKNELLLPPKWQKTLSGFDGICNFYYDAINDYHYFSEKLPEIFGISVKQQFKPSLKLLLQLVHEKDRIRVNDTVQKAVQNRTGYQTEYRIVRKDQSIRYLFEQTEIILDPNGNLDGFVGFIQDITNSKISSEVLENEKQLMPLYENPDVGIWSIDITTGNCLECSKGIEQVTGYSKGDFNNGIQWASLVHQEDLSKYLEVQHQLNAGISLRHQYRIHHKNGNVKWVQDYTIPTLDENGNLIRVDGLTSDITEQKLLEEKLNFLAEYDSLTKLPNQQKFNAQLQAMANNYANSHRKFAVLILDMDRFKYITGTIGHHIGDKLIVQVAERINKILSTKEFLARYREDRFCIIVENIASIEAVKYLAQQLISSFNEPFFVEDYQLFVSLNIGISTFPENGINSVELLRNAKLALFKSQKEGKSNYHIISQSNSIQSYKSFIIGRDLKKALENNEMALYFQPRVDAITNVIIGAEALIRWIHPEWGIISPHEFLAIAEENGLIKEVDDWVLNEACSILRKWKESNMGTIPISINISAIHFSIYNWQNTVAKVIKEADIDPRNIEFEITESLLLNNNRIVQNTIDFFRNMGIKISLDDFGTGYSSLAYLTKFSFDTIKVDKSFIRDMLQDEKVLFIVKSIFLMAKELNIKVVAEGVETLKQLKELRKLQCNEIQGYLYSHPVPITEFEALLKTKTLMPLDPESKAKQSNRKYHRTQFSNPLEADMQILSIGGKSVQLGKTKVLVQDMSVGGLRFVSNLTLPVREDIIFQFKVELLGRSISMLGRVIWKEEMNEELLEYGVSFMIDQNEQIKINTLLSSYHVLLKNKHNLPSHRLTSEHINHYFKN
ncbi:EAL domain-containing protein [Rummeliibacillus sp. JY-2-4R]